MRRLMAVVAVAWLAQTALGQTAVRFVVDGVADPGVFDTPSGLSPVEKVSTAVQQQAYTDAIFHLGAYTHGVAFAIDVANTDAPFPLGEMEFDTPGMALPKNKETRLLKSELVVGRLTYDAGDFKKTMTAEVLKLPVYVARGRFANAQWYLPLTTMHWQAAQDCYRTAVMLHVAKLYGDKPIAKANGRVYPVRFIQAELKPVAAPVAAPAGAAGGAGGPPASGGEAPPAGAAGAVAKAAEPGAGERPEIKFDSTKYVYELQMEVRVRLDGITFAEAPAAPKGTPKTPEAGAPASGLGAPAAPAVKPVQPAMTPSGLEVPGKP